MGKLSTATLTDASDNRYQFDVYTMDSMFREGYPGVYMIARRYKLEDGQFTLEPLFVGESADLSTLYGYHPQQACIQKHGGNCKCIYHVKSKEKREAIVENLIAALGPHCNL